MFLIRNRAEFREYLEHLQKMFKSQRKALVLKKDLRFQDGVEYGFGFALDALADWEQQQPDAEDKSVIDNPKNTEVWLPEPDRHGDYYYADGTCVMASRSLSGTFLAGIRNGNYIRSATKTGRFPTAIDAARALFDRGVGPAASQKPEKIFPENPRERETEIWLPKPDSEGKYRYPDNSWIEPSKIHNNQWIIYTSNPRNRKHERNNTGTRYFACPELAAGALAEIGEGPAASPNPEPIKKGDS
jgi:hypothetical protein